MKKIITVSVSALVLLTLVAVFAFRAESDGPGTKDKLSITGTWQLDSYKYGSSAGSFSIVTPNRPHLKLITDQRFLWSTYDTLSKKILESAGGKYTLEGDTYTESIDFGYGMDSYLGGKSVFRIRLEEDIFYLSGKLSDGYRIEEVWTRIK